jgi:NADH-quinone oxidoreductase subunit L
VENTSTFDILTFAALLAPLLSFLLCLIIPNGYSWLTTIISPMLLLISASISVYLLATFSANSSFTLSLEWFRVGEYAFNSNLELNRWSVLMLPIVTVISFLVHLYSVGYMAGDNGIKRYFAMLGFFTFAMLGIVLSDNLLVIFIFWELVGFSSYLLIGHWLEKTPASKAAQKAFMFNRIGDVGFLVGIMIIWTNTQTLDLQILLNQTEIQLWQTAASLCIFCGVVGKSAQVPLFTWLPDAMEGPTPVSALIHAATMVAAGVFLLARVFPLFTETSLNVVAITGSFTALLAAVFALMQFDIKKILAYSTISQLGLMITAVGVGAPNAAMLHLTTHAFFKACLFLGAGSIIYAMHLASKQIENFDVQDIRNLGGLRKKMPTTFYTFMLAAASLAGVPFFSGFISKDSILESIWNWSGSMQSIILVLTLTTSVFTILYIFRMVRFIFFGNENQYTASVTETPWVMRIAMVILASASIWIFVSTNPFGSSGWITQLVGTTPISTKVTAYSAAIVTLTLIIASRLYSKNSIPKSVTIFRNGFQMDWVYHKLFERPAIQLADASNKIDRTWIDGFIHFLAYSQVLFAHLITWFDKHIIDGSVNASAWAASATGNFIRSFQAGKIQLYIFWAMIGLIIFLFFTLI